MTASLPRALFFGLFAAAVVLGAVEAIHVATAAGSSLDTGGRGLAALWALSPYVLIGAVLGGLVAMLSGVWEAARRVADPTAPSTRWADGTAALLACGAFLCVQFLAAWAALGGEAATGRSGALAVLTPVSAVIALYAWAVLRVQLGALDRRTGGRASPALGAAILIGGLATVLWTLRANQGLEQSLGRWAPIFVGGFAVLAVVVAFLLYRFSPGFGGAGAQRAAVALGLLAAAGTADLVVHLDHHPEVKQVLLDRALAIAPLVRVTQPLFDNDGDGYAGLLGGGDCDDGDPTINPGAREVPRNGRDDDCYGGDSPGRRPPPPAPKRVDRAARTAAGQPALVEEPNVILITIDTLRADHLGYAGYDAHPITPNLDALAGDGLRFTWAFAQGAQTKQSMPSLFVGKYFSEIIRTPHHWATTLPENVTIAERFQSAGYRTIGVPAHNFFRPNYGLKQGFEHYDLAVIEEHGTRTAYVVTGKMVTNRTLAWLRQQAPGRPFFLWVHYFDPHHFYQNHDGVDFGRDELGRYAEEVWYTDQQIGRVLDWLGDSPFADNTYVMLTSDHAEAFKEHGYTFHGQTLNNDQLHVPMFISGPGIPSRTIRQPVSNIDVVPTLMDLIGQPPDPALRGVSLLQYIDDPDAPHPPVFAEMVKDESHSDRRMMVDWPYKLQYGVTFNSYWLYDLSKDPTEQKNLALRRPKVLARLQKRLRQWMSEEVDVYEPVPY